MTKVVSSSLETKNGMPVFSQTNTSIMALIKSVENGGKLNAFLDEHPEITLPTAMEVLDMVGLSHKLNESHFIRPAGTSDMKFVS